VVGWGGRVLVLTHVKELLEQLHHHIKIVDPDMEVGLYSAGLKSKESGHPVTVAGIQSAVNNPDAFGHIDLIIVDECHRIPDDGEGQYRTLIFDLMAINPRIRIAGASATPYRLGSGMICGPDNILNHVCYEIGVKQLMAEGYLCPVVSKGGPTELDTSKLHVRAGDFINSELEELLSDKGLITEACTDIIERTQNRNSVLVFCAGIDHAVEVAGQLYHGGSVDFVFGETPNDERDAIINRFKAGDLKYLVNVNVLTLGFDAPNIDSVVMLRPTMSPGLYYQMVGRGFRLHESKQNCLILDYSGNVIRHGPVDSIRVETSKTKGSGEAPGKKCPECLALIHAGYSVCPDCGFEFPKHDPKHSNRAGDDAVISGEVHDEVQEVGEVGYFVHRKRGASDDAPKTMRVEYYVSFFPVSEWICFEHTGYAREKAVAWWRKRSDLPVPQTAQEAVDLSESLAVPEAVVVRHVAGEKYSRIVDYLNLKAGHSVDSPR